MGVEYQTLAPQNSMANRIDGATLHSWGEIPIDQEPHQGGERRKSKVSGGTTMHCKATSFRVLLVDEISTAALHVLGLLEKHTAQAKQSTPFAEDASGHLRAWGGVNLVIAGDWLQLPNVCAKSIFRNPFLKDYSTVERRMLDIYFGI